MKRFSLETGDKFVHQKTKGIYVFDGLSYSTKTNNAEVAYHNTLKESFTRDMGEFFGYTEDKQKRFLPLEEYLETYNVEVVVDNYNEEQYLVEVLDILEVNYSKYVLYIRHDEEIPEDEMISMYVDKIIENNNGYVVEVIEDDEEYKEVKKKVDQFLESLKEED